MFTWLFGLLTFYCSSKQRTCYHKQTLGTIKIIVFRWRFSVHHNFLLYNNENGDVNIKTHVGLGTPKLVIINQSAQSSLVYELNGRPRCFAIRTVLTVHNI